MNILSRRLVLAGVFFALVVCGYFAVILTGDGKVPEEVLHRPSPMPDRIILTWSGDPATSQSVTWRTDATVQEAVAQIAVSEDGPDFTESAREVEAVSQLLSSDLSDAMYHSAGFTDLQPKTLYAYRVGDGSNWSEWNQFRTASDQPDPLTFIYVGDAQNSIFEHWSRVIRMGFTAAPEANFIVHAGDLINRPGSDADWGEWFRAAGWINRSVTSFPTPGNHEYWGDEGEKSVSRHWRPQFALPENGPPGLEETCYYIDIQGLRMVSMNSSEMLQEQVEWLDTLLADNPNRWTILTHHHPIYSSAQGRDNKELRELWKPVFDKHAVDLVLQGHDHSYGRSNLISGVNMRSGAGGTVYVVSISGPKHYRVAPQVWMQRLAERKQLFQIIRINGDTLQYEAHTATGLLYDAFELRKRPDGTNEIINRAPDTAERFNATGGE